MCHVHSVLTGTKTIHWIHGNWNDRGFLAVIYVPTSSGSADTGLVYLSRAQPPISWFSFFFKKNVLSIN